MGQGTASDLVVQVVLIAESMRLQAMMATYGIQTQTPLEVEPVQIWPPSQLVKMYELLGINLKLGLKGRPARPIGALGTSKLYRIFGQTVLCYPLTFELSDFYLSHDMALLIDDIKNELHFVGKYWRMSGRPTVCILIREEHLRDVNFKEMLDLLVEFKKGYLQSGLKIKTGRLQNLISSSTKLVNLKEVNKGRLRNGFNLSKAVNLVCYPQPIALYEHRPTWPDIMDALRTCDTLYAQSQLLGILYNREGNHFTLPDGTTAKERLERLSRQAGALRHWSVVRYCSSILQKLVDSISPYITSILVSGKQITVGTYGHKEVAIDHPRTPKEIHELLYDVIREPYDAVLQQEIILYVGRLISTTPHLFDGIVKIRVGSFVEAMKFYLSFKNEKQTTLESLAPSQVRRVLYKVLTDTDLEPRERRLIEGATWPPGLPLQ
ncbi:unnamed protein product [Medioppia subpectinata]|uniref:Phosphorylase b kinase regulatory subunit n=1 Tax=Medioppia subpectinata TaxID=1979941 RepID=A0A7R9Q136_9ACAR|nr:unnamed protein product [Medioppia subpectinata]CAG2107910.1 unnamed protein product [Medioppia subpectinata]